MTDNLARVLIMAEELPEKNVNERLKCFRCSSLCSADKRIVIFEKNCHIFAEIITSVLNIDINCYANNTNNNLLVCKTSCYTNMYKWLLKFQRATEKVEVKSQKKFKMPFKPDQGLNDASSFRWE